LQLAPPYEYEFKKLPIDIITGDKVFVALILGIDKGGEKGSKPPLSLAAAVPADLTGGSGGEKLNHALPDPHRPL
jgi:hypothetical protein